MIGQILKGRYRIAEVIGRGGIAIVYKAWDAERQSYVAIKFLQPHMADQPNSVRRFLREGRMMQSLDSPHIVRLLDFDQYRGQYYMVFEYVQGVTLQQRLEQERTLLPLAVLGIARQVLSALDCAWRQHIVHRDISLNNLIQVPSGLIKVMDFGIAKNYHYDPMTRLGQPLGTAYYISPEQAQGKSVDVRSDIYSLGAVLYHLLSGRPPFDGPSIPHIMHQHVMAALPPLRQWRPDIPPSFEQLVHQAMAKNPDLRFQNPTRMMQSVEICRRDLASGHSLPTPVFRRKNPSFGQQNWWGLVLMGMGLLLVFLLIYLLTTSVAGSQPLHGPAMVPP